MNEKKWDGKLFYIYDSWVFFISTILLIIVFSIPFLIWIFSWFKIVIWNIEDLLFVIVDIIFLILLILKLIHRKSYIKTWEKYLTIYKPQRRYSFKFIKYDIKYDDIDWCFFRDIKCIIYEPWLPNTNRYLFIIKKFDWDYILFARNDFSGKWIYNKKWILWLGKKTNSKFQELKNELQSKKIQMYNPKMHYNEFSYILKENRYKIRMWYLYKKHYYKVKNVKNQKKQYP